MNNDNLPELRDIHLPDGDISWFPIAYGWWVILGGLAVLFIITELFIYLRRKSKKRYALRLLHDIPSANIVNAAGQMSEILRRICVFKYPQAAAMFGKEWLDFLNRHSKKALETPAAGLLLNAPYISPETQTYTTQDLQTLRSFCAEWIGENL